MAIAFTPNMRTRNATNFCGRLQQGENVLDVSCGNGALTFDMARTGALVTGIDMNTDCIEVAREKFRHENVEYLTGDACEDLSGYVFDTIVLSNVLKHI